MKYDICDKARSVLADYLATISFTGDDSLEDIYARLQVEFVNELVSLVLCPMDLVPQKRGRLQGLKDTIELISDKVKRNLVDED